MQVVPARLVIRFAGSDCRTPRRVYFALSIISFPCYNQGMNRISNKRALLMFSLFALGFAMLTFAHRIHNPYQHRGDLWYPALRYGSFMLLGFAGGIGIRPSLLGAIFGGVIMLTIIVISDLW
jgi:hypothetical protein